MSMHPFFHSAKVHFFCHLSAITFALGLLAPPVGAATIFLKDGRQFQGTVDDSASDDQIVVIHIAATDEKAATAIIKIARAKIKSIDNASAPPAGSNDAAKQTEQSALKKAEGELAADPSNEALRKKVEELRLAIQNHERLNYSGLFEKIDKLVADKKYEEAISEADAMLAHITNEGARTQCSRLKAQAHIGLARQFGEFVNLMEEEKNYAEAMKADPENPTAPLEMAEILKSSPSRKADRIASYEKALALADKKPGLLNVKTVLDTQYKIAELYLDEKRFVEAGDKFLQVMLNDKNLSHAKPDDQALTAYARIPVAGMDPAVREHIIANVRTLLKVKPNKQQAHLLLGHIYFDQKNWTAARDSFLLAVKHTEPSAPAMIMQDALFTLALCLHKLHQDQDAVSAFDKLLALKPDHYDGLCELADILMENDNAADATRFYEQAVAVDADKSRAYLGRGSSLENQGKFEDARKSFSEVLARNEKNTPAQLAIARSYFHEKRYDETILEAEKAKELIRGHYKLSTDDSSTTAAAAAPVVATPKPSPSPKPSPTPAAVTVAAATKATSGTVAAAAKATSATVAAVAAMPIATPAPVSTASSKDDAELLTKITDEDRLLMAEADTLIGKANVYGQPPKTNLARDFFTVALKFAPKYAPAYEGLGFSYAADKLDQQAEDSFQKAIAQDATNPAYYLSFAIYWQKDRTTPEKALPFYLKYQELGGRDPQVAARIKECGGTPKS